MRSIVLLLGVVLGWMALDHLARTGHARQLAGAGAFPFPTRDAHAAVNLFEHEDVVRWAGELGCDEAQLRTAIGEVGTSVARIDDYLRSHAS